VLGAWALWWPGDGRIVPAGIGLSCRQPGRYHHDLSNCSLQNQPLDHRHTHTHSQSHLLFNPKSCTWIKNKHMGCTPNPNSTHAILGIPHVQT
jgi:hypothetical protein